MNSIFARLPVSVFELMSRLSREHNAINLGQGFPDGPGPEDVRRKAAEAVIHGWNQYPPMMGVPQLRQAIADHYLRFQHLVLDPEQEVMVTSGATEALAGALIGLIEPGDEVVLFQPMYDAYLPLVQRAGGTVRYVTLKPPHWRFTEVDLERAFSRRTKLVLLNNPLNPSGVVYSRADLELLAAFCIRFDAVAICDEVWEHVIFDDNSHIPLIAIAGMRERAVKIGSAGKIFSLTGWKVGFVACCPALMRVLSKAHQFLTFTTPPNLQAAVAYGLDKEDGYFSSMRAAFQRSRDRFSDGLKQCGFSVLPSQGTYFVNIDLVPLNEMDDVDFCHRLIVKYGVAAIPVSAFYMEDAVRTVVRFCFAKHDATLDQALDRLAKMELSSR
jgi:N-succinyldiaminopimelate aminotransferase